MILRRMQCVTEGRRVCYCEKESGILRRGVCVTEERTVCY